MRTPFKALSVLFVLVLLLVAASLASAQAATPEATAPAPSGVTVNVEPSTPAPINPGETASIAFILIGGLIGSLAVGIPALVVVTGMSKAQKDLAEKLFLSQPPAAVEKERAALALVDKAIDVFGKLLVVAKEITDGQPNSDPAAPGGTS